MDSARFMSMSFQRARLQMIASSLSYARCSNHLSQYTTTHVAASTHQALLQYSLCIISSHRYASAIEKIVVPAEKIPERWTALYPRSVIPGCLLVTRVKTVLEKRS